MSYKYTEMKLFWNNCLTIRLDNFCFRVLFASNRYLFLNKKKSCSFVTPTHTITRNNKEQISIIKEGNHFRSKYLQSTQFICRFINTTTSQIEKKINIKLLYKILLFIQYFTNRLFNDQ